MMTHQLFNTAVALLLLATALWVIYLSRSQPQKRALFLIGGVLLALLGGAVLWGMWMTPPGPEPAPSAQLSAEEEQRRIYESQTALPTDTPLQIIQKMGCAVCHKIPTVPHATVGVNGPVLILGTTAPKRLASADYRAQVAAGRAHATTTKEYVIESIVDPSAFFAPGYDPDESHEIVPMYPHYGKKFTPEALEILALFLLSIDEDAARREGLPGHTTP